jgi:AraC-like DNA-binding protein
MNQDPRLSSLPAPPPWAERFRSDDLDEVREWVASSTGEHSRVVHDPGPLRFELAVLTGSKLALGWGRVGVAKTIRGASTGVLLHLQPVPGSTYRFGRSEHLAGADSAVLVAPGQDFTRRSPPGQALSLAVDAQSLDAEIAARVSADGSESLPRSRPVMLDACDQAELMSALSEFVDASAPGSDPRSRLHGEANVVSAVADLLLQRDVIVRSRPVTARRLGDLEDWIEAHLEEPITLGRLCGVAGVGGRALAKIFDLRRGMSPMRYVTERRLAAVHARLLMASNADEVTAIASDLGFTHLGRFAISYKEVFGESPSQTLRRSYRARASA